MRVDISYPPPYEGGYFLSTLLWGWISFIHPVTTRFMSYKDNWQAIIAEKSISGVGKKHVVYLGWFYLLWRKITNSAFLRVDFGWINNNIKFSLKLVQIEITSTLPSVGWMWISICTRSIRIWYYYLSTLIHPQKAKLIVIFHAGI